MPLVAQHFANRTIQYISISLAVLGSSCRDFSSVGLLLSSISSFALYVSASEHLCRAGALALYLSAAEHLARTASCVAPTMATQPLQHLTQLSAYVGAWMLKVAMDPQVIEYNWIKSGNRSASNDPSHGNTVEHKRRRDIERTKQRSN